MIFRSYAATFFAIIMVFAALKCAALHIVWRVVMADVATDADASATLDSELFTIVRGMVTVRSLQMRTVLLTQRSKHVEETKNQC